MQISNSDLEEFTTIYRTEFKKGISKQDALEMATRLVNLYQMIYRALPGEKEGVTKPPSEDLGFRDASFPNPE